VLHYLRRLCRGCSMKGRRLVGAKVVGRRCYQQLVKRFSTHSGGGRRRATIISRRCPRYTAVSARNTEGPLHCCCHILLNNGLSVTVQQMMQRHRSSVAVSCRCRVFIVSIRYFYSLPLLIINYEDRRCHSLGIVI